MASTLSLETAASHQTELGRLISANAHAHSTYEVFRDFCELAAISLRNTVDLVRWNEREARYLGIMEGYSREETVRFAHMLGRLRLALHTELSDALGSLYMSLNLGNQWTGQFFTPYDLALLTARTTLHDAGALIDQNGFLTVYEPAAGGGAMVIAAAEVLQDQGFDYRETLHVTAQDIDPIAVHMCYVQLTLLDVPAVVVHGDTLNPKNVTDVWPTPAHILGGWRRRLAKVERKRQEPADSDACPEAW